MNLKTLIYIGRLQQIMTELVAFLSSEEKNWGHIARLTDEHDWERIFLVTNEIGKNNFKSKKNVEFVIIDSQKPVFELIEDIKKELRGKITDMEVALNLVCGSGKEHMALLSALLKLGVGIRLIAVTKDGVKEL